MLVWSVVGRGPSMVEAQWSTVVAGGCMVLDGQGSTLDASRLAVDGVPTESDRMESNKKVTVMMVTLLLLWTWGSQMA